MHLPIQIAALHAPAGIERIEVLAIRYCVAGYETL